MHPMIRIVVVALALVLATDSHAQAPTGQRLRGETEAAQTRKKITEAQQKLANGKTAEAVDELQRVLDESGDELVLVQGNHYQPARRLVHRYLASLPAEALKVYRNRLEKAAQALLDEAKRTNDDKPIRELIDRYFVSRPTEEGLQLLGELQFARGDLRSAERTWRTLLPGNANDLRFPNPQRDTAGVWARIILTLHYLGERDRANEEFQQFALKHPTATGRLAGSDGKYIDTLKLIFSKPSDLREGSPGWSALGGKVSRDGNARAEFPHRFPNTSAWARQIPLATTQNPPRPASIPPAKALVFQPIISGDYAYITDGARILAFHTRTGESSVAFDLREQALGLSWNKGDLDIPNLKGIDFTLSAIDGTIVARLGIDADFANKGNISRTYIFGLKPSLTPKHTLTEAWKISPQAGHSWGRNLVCGDGMIFATSQKVDDKERIVTSLHAYSNPPGKEPLWSSELAEIEASLGSKSRSDQLSLADGRVIFQSGFGVTVALNQKSGKPLWAYRASGSTEPNIFRDDSPAVTSAGMVYIAPQSSKRIHAIDSDTGELKWESPDLSVQHLVGVSDNRLIATISGPNKGIRGFNLRNGASNYPDGWQNHDDPHLPTHGRGLTNDKFVLWPTKNRLYVLDSSDGSVAKPPVAIPTGNIAYADGVLIVASATHVYGYITTSDATPKPVPAKPVEVHANAPAYDRNAVVRVAPIDDPVDMPAAKAGLILTKTITYRGWPLAGMERAERFWVCDGNTITGLLVRNPRDRIAYELKHYLYLTDCVDAGERMIVYGPGGILALQSNSDRVLWELATPEATTWQLTGSRAIGMIGKRVLISVDLGTGRVAWMMNANGRRRYEQFALESAPSFTEMTIFAHRIHVGTTHGLHHAIDIDTGRIAKTWPTTETAWVTPPAVLGKRLIAPNAEYGLEAMDEILTTAWQFAIGGEASRSGVAPQVRAFDRRVIACLPRNFGVELFQLDPDTGQSHWKTRRFLNVSDLDLTYAIADREALYVVADRELIALSWTTGRKIWSLALPDLAGSRWHLRIGRHALFAWPSEPVPVEDFGNVSTRVLKKMLNEPSLELFVYRCLAMYEGWLNRALPILVVNKITGRVEQQIDVLVSGPWIDVRFVDTDILVSSMGRVDRMSPKD